MKLVSIKFSYTFFYRGKFIVLFGVLDLAFFLWKLLAFTRLPTSKGRRRYKNVAEGPSHRE